MELNMEPTTLPKKPIDNWQHVRDEWIAAVQQLIQEVESWAQKQGWAVRREPKKVEEFRIGTYEVPQLLIQLPAGRFLLDPVARFVTGADGLIDLYVLPSYDAVMISRNQDGWFLHPSDQEGPRQTLSEQSFVDTVLQLARAA
jgi:hypothetical protein